MFPLPDTTDFNRMLRFLFLVAMYAAMIALLSFAFNRPAHAAELGIFDQVRPALGDLAAFAITALVAYAVQRFKAWTGIEIEARHREALQSALANAARKMIGGASINDAIEYVEDSVPDALDHLGVTDRGRIHDLLLPHISGLSPALSKG